MIRYSGARRGRTEKGKSRTRTKKEMQEENEPMGDNAMVGAKNTLGGAALHQLHTRQKTKHKKKEGLEVTIG